MGEQKNASDFSAKELAAYAADKSASTVERLLNEEKAGANRKTAVEPMKARLKELKATTGGSTSSTTQAKPTTTAATSAPPPEPPTDPAKVQPEAGEPVATKEGDKALERFDINAEEREALSYPPDRTAAVDTSLPAPARLAGLKAKGRADTGAEGPIAGTGAHRLAAPAPAVPPGAPPEHSHPDRHDARREPVAYPIAPPAPTQGPGVESPARGAKRVTVPAGAPAPTDDDTPRVDYPQQ